MIVLKSQRTELDEISVKTADLPNRSSNNKMPYY